MDGENRYLSTAQAAAAMGLSVTTVKRWVDEGVLSARKTVGGHRKVRVADVLRLMRESEVPDSELRQFLPRTDDLDFSNPAVIARQLISALRSEDYSLINRLFQGTRQCGFAMDVLADQVVGPSITELGREAGPERPRLSSRAMQALIVALSELVGAVRVQVPSGEPLAVGGTVEDGALVAPLLSTLVLLDSGWDVVNLGTASPGVFRERLHDFRPRLLWLNVPSSADASSLVKVCEQIAREARGCEVVMVDDRGSTIDWPEVPHLTVCQSMSELAAFANTMHGRPGLPRKGRPPRGERERPFGERK